MSGYSYQVVVCASGGGGNLQALIDSQKTVGFMISKLITDRDCGAIERAAQNNIPFTNLNKKELGNEAYWASFIESIPAQTDLIILAGFIPVVPAAICEAWQGKMINTHPSLLPKYGGKGMIGVKVQEAVIAAGEKEAGCTVHFVSAQIDGGDILLQTKIPVLDGESAWGLGGRVFQEENKLLVKAVEILKQRGSHGNVA